ncbi:MAG: alpha/beta hydrolase [Trueperaceae bacterium]|nr:alpha/beta hydrolase [Trueperaceae bacterium]
MARTQRDTRGDDPLHVSVVAQAGPVRGRVAVLHGFAEHGGRYGELARTFAAQGLEVHVLDLRGHGLSSGVRALVRDVSETANDVVVLLERLRAAGGPVLGFGHSFGGALMLRAAQLRPDLVDAVAVTGPYLKTALDDPPWLFGVVDVVSRVLPLVRGRPIDATVVSTIPAEVRRYVDDPLVDVGGVRLASVRELHALGPRVLADAGRLVTPTLIVHGGADRLSSPRGSRELRDGAGADDVTLIEVPGNAHDLLHDVASEQVLSTIVTWSLERLGLAGRA